MPDSAEKNLPVHDRPVGDQPVSDLPLPPPPAAAPAPPPKIGSAAHLAQHALWSPAEAFELLVESVRDYAVFLVTPEGRIGSWSLGVEHLLGYGEADFLHLELADLFVEEDRATDAPIHEMKRAALMGRTADDRWHLRADGSRLWVSGILTSLLDDNNNLRGFLKVMRDNTAQRLLEEEREELLGRERAARVAAEDADLAKDRFIATVTHELRSPLNVIMGWMQMLREPFLTDAERLQGLETVERNVSGMGRLVEDLLDTTRIREERMLLDLQPVDIGPLIAQVIEEFRPIAREKNLTLHTEIECIAKVNADAGRLRQILSNLLSNSAKFTPPGGDIWVSLVCDDTTVRLTVRDNGQGIAPDFLPEAFKTFEQQKRAQAGGLGLGLAIVQSLVERHAGVVTAHSDGEGQGATFVVEIPRIATAD